MKNVWLYTKGKNGVFYCTKCGGFYYKDLQQKDVPSIAATGIICGILFRAWSMIEFGEVFFYYSLVALNLVVLTILILFSIVDWKKCRSYYPMRGELKDNLIEIRKTYRRSVIASAVFLFMGLFSLFSAIKHLSLLWAIVEVICLASLYFTVFPSGLLYKKSVIKKIESGDL